MFDLSIFFSLFYFIPLLLLIPLIKLFRFHPRVRQIEFQCNPALFTVTEVEFMKALYIAVDGKASIFGKVRIADVLAPRKNLSRSNWQVSFNKIAMKHFDFVICNNEDLSIICAIELDDSSHNRKDRIERDLFVNGACDSAGLPLIRFKVSSSYLTSDLQDKLSLYF